MKDTECPYCEEPQDIDHDEGYGYEEGIIYEQQCDDCKMNFVYTTAILYDYETTMADCLNDGKHNYVPTGTYPKEYTKMYCTMCDNRREPTKEEFLEILKEN